MVDILSLMPYTKYQTNFGKLLFSLHEYNMNMAE